MIKGFIGGFVIGFIMGTLSFSISVIAQVIVLLFVVYKLKKEKAITEEKLFFSLLFLGIGVGDIICLIF